ncbi:MAG TPA: OmpA family protein [Vicinamibacterales bacterium]|jgi:peptidoglycan-associated lipoprotein|nr:OmpA family protein [Vicinamibacterales bacterium]
MRKSLVAASLLALTVAVAPACATKKFVRTEVGGVNQKVDTLTGTVEETQERTRQNTERIGVVDQKAEAAGKAAAGAQSSADAAGKAAAAASERANQVGTQLGGRIDEVVASSRRLVYEVTLSEDQGNFKFGGTDLPDTAKARLDEIVTSAKADPKGIYIEIEGHTDNVGNPAFNEKLGMERAEVVKRYLYEQHQVPLHKINVISYGESKPVAPNNTRDGRAQNRRVVVRILS